MKVIRIPYPAGERIIALGTFDGVHKGHRSLIRTAKRKASEYNVPLRIFTFDRHPLEILAPQRPPEMLSTIPEKAREISRLGSDEMELMVFNRQTANLEPEDFLDSLRKRIDIRAIVAGWNYSFGKKGRGDADLLLHYGKIHGYDVIIVPPETLEDGTAISSTLVRQKLKEGNITEANQLLGYNYSLTGSVSAGKRQGHLLGFPTANILPWKRKALPRYGVYTCLAETDHDLFPAIANIGLQPTIPSGHVTVEAHILEEDCPDLYGKKVRLVPLAMLREERRFSSQKELKDQIEKDCQVARNLFNMA